MAFKNKRSAKKPSFIRSSEVVVYERSLRTGIIHF